MKTSQAAKISYLELVFPPISNQEAVYLEDEPALEPLLRSSDFYMICGKAKGSFTEITLNKEELIINLNITIGGEIRDSGAISIKDLPYIKNKEEIKFCVKAGNSYIELLEGNDNDPEAKIIERFTPEGILWHRSKCLSGITGFEKYRELLTFDLLYVGIAKVGDSYDRLIKKGHKARMQILSNEPQRYPGARVTDEIFLLLFKIEPIVLTSYELEHEFTDDDISPTIDLKRVVADAEKAYVSLLKPEYNIIKFKNYPKGKDGLYNSKYDRYGYSISEAITFNTAQGQLKGGYDCFSLGLTNEADFIFIENDVVTLYVSGKDFPSGNEAI